MARPSIADTPLLKTARERFKLADEADSDQAQRERDDIAFEAGDQWPADIRQARMGQQPTNGMPAVPARPTLTINQIRGPVRQVLNEERQADLGIELVAADDFGDLGITPDDTEVQLREGLVRRIQRDSMAADARTWAFKRAVIAGRGYYLVNTRYLPGKTWDQEVCVERIYNQAGVLLDPSHEQPDGSDADWEFIGTWMPWDRYKAQYPTAVDGADNVMADCSEADFVAMTEEYPKWYRQTTSYTDNKGQTQELKQQAVRVVSYWYTDRVSRTLCLLADGSSAWKDELPKDAEIVDERTEVEKTIRYCLIGGGVQILDQTDWAGPDMPIVKVLGEEILPYDDQRRVEGMVRCARSSQEALNYMISKQVEQIGLTPIAPLMLDPEAIEGYEAEYDLANTRTIGRLKYKTYDDQGRELHPPLRPPVDPNILPISQSIALFDQTIKNTTAVSDPAMGQTDPSVKSARHARYLIEESRISTSNFLDNLARSARYEGQIENNLLYPIYGARPGRLVRILTGEGEGQMMRIADPEQGPQQAAMADKAAKVGKLTKDAHFNVIVKIAKNTDNRREQFVRMFGDILGADPTQMAVGGDLFYKNMDIPEARQLAKRQRAMLAPPVQQLLAAEEQGQQVDPASMAQIQALTEQLQHAEAALQELSKDREGNELKAKTDLEIAALNADRDLRLEQMKLGLQMKQAEIDFEKAKMDNATKLRVAEINAETKGLVSAQALEHEAIALAHTQEHEATMADDQREHEARVEEQGQRHDAEMADRAQAFEAGENERNRQAQPEADA